MFRVETYAYAKCDELKQKVGMIICLSIYTKKITKNKGNKIIR